MHVRTCNWGLLIFITVLFPRMTHNHGVSVLPFLVFCSSIQHGYAYSYRMARRTYTRLAILE